MSDLIETFNTIITTQHHRFEVIIAVCNIFLNKNKRLLCLLPTNIQEDIVLLTEDTTTANTKLYVVSMVEALDNTKELISIPLKIPSILNNDIEQVIRDVTALISDTTDFYIKIKADGQWELYSKG
jgi:hypothetical protein